MGTINRLIVELLRLNRMGPTLWAPIIDISLVLTFVSMASRQLVPSPMPILFATLVLRRCMFRELVLRLLFVHWM